MSVRVAQDWQPKKMLTSCPTAGVIGAMPPTPHQAHGLWSDSDTDLDNNGSGPAGYLPHYIFGLTLPDHLFPFLDEATAGLRGCGTRPGLEGSQHPSRV